MIIAPPTGPRLLGFDVILIGSVLAAIAAMAVMLAIYAAVTVKDPMAKRIKALNARREELKSGIITQKSRKRQSLVQRSEATDKMKDTLKGMKVLQESQVKIIQQKLAQAGIRNKEYAVVVIFARMVLPITLGFIGAIVLYWTNTFPDWGSIKRFAAFAFLVIAGYKGPEVYLKNRANKRTNEIRKGLPDALDLLVICAEAGLTVDAAFNRVAKELGRAYPELGDEFALHHRVIV